MIKINQTPQHQFIEEIRRRKGVGTGRIAGDNEGDLHRAIDRLSKDIYSKDVHFILELIQNAEDNPYSSGKDPQLIFKILDQDPINSPETEGALLVINNEKGFLEKNVKAICSIGETTKDKREGYIGEKGIGFKSVFQITAKPYIFSAGYQFSFNDQPDDELGFGYIIPYWEKRIPQLIEKFQDQTCILLPFRKGKRIAVQDELLQISPETILFLNKLKALQISVNDQILTEVYRVDKDFPRIEILNNKTSFSYWLSEIDFNKNDEIKEEKREGINTRKVSVAFPISVKKEPDVGVFAFLPTSSNLKSGFDFIVNADFLLSTNREQILEHLPWNQWLRDCISPCFLNGFQEMLLEKELQLSTYRFIPLVTENRSDFFNPTVYQIIESLKEFNIILTTSGELVRPEVARFASIEIRDLLEGETLPTNLDKIHFVHPELEVNHFRERLESIGVTELSEEEFLEILQDEDWIAKHNYEWFYRLYEFLHTQKWGDKETLSEIKLIPVRTGLILKPSDKNGVYLPDEKADEMIKEHSEAITFSDIQFLNDGLYKKLLLNKNLLDWAKEALILFDLDKSMIAQELAIRLNNDIEGLDDKSILWTTKFICQYWGELGDTQKEVVKENLPLLLENRERIFLQNFPSESSLVFPVNFNTKSGWQIVFPDPDDRTHMLVLSRLYLKNEEKENYEKWEKFFNDLGATRYPFPQKIAWDVSWSFPKEAPQIHKTMWDKNYYSTRGKKLYDWKIPEWLKNPGEEKKETNVKRAKALVEWLESQADDLNHSWYQPEWVIGKIEYFYRTPQFQEQKSEFLNLLQISKWFPTNHGLKHPSEVFINKLEFKELFGNSISLSEIKISNELASWLNVRTSATYQEILDFLRGLPGQTTETVSLKLLKKIYAFISERWNQETRELFSKESLIFIPNSDKKWFCADEVIWLNKSEVFEDFFGYLEDDYEDLKNFFLDKLKIKYDVDEEIYARKWKSISQNSEGYEAKKIETALVRIFPVMLGVAKKETKPEWWKEFKETVKFWTQNDSFVLPSRVFVPDDSDYKKVFNELGVAFVWVPPKDSFFDYQILYSELGVRSLSENVEISAEVEGSIIFTDEPILLTAAVKRAICYYLRNQARPIYERLKENGVLETFLKTKEYLVEKLNFSLTLFEKQEEMKDRIAFYDQNQGILYLSDNYSKDDWSTYVPTMISRKLARSQIVNELEGIIGWIISLSETGISGIVKKRNWNMSSEERKWINEIINFTNETRLIDDSSQEEKQDDVFVPGVEDDEEIGIHEEEEQENELISDDGNDEFTEFEDLTGVRKKLLDADDLIEQPKVGKEEQTEQSKKPGSRSTSGDYSADFSQQGRTSVGSTRKPSDEKMMTTRLNSYVYPVGEVSTYHENPAFSIKRDQKGKKGVELVMQYERKRGHAPKDMEEEQTNHPGYDIESQDQNGEIRYIEVKATEYFWDSQHPASLTKFEFKTAKELGEKYWLYIVEKVNSEDPEIFEVKDPANRVGYYMFDRGWIPREEKGEDV